MAQNADIPVFTLFGETSNFPDVVHCERFSARAPVHGWRISAHRHSQISQLFLIADGHISGRVDDLNTTLESGEFLFVPVQMVHEFVFEPDTEGLVISLPLSVVNSIGPSSQDILIALSKPFVGIAPPRLRQLADLLVETTKGSSIFRAQEALGLAHSMLALVAQAAFDTNLLPSRETDARLTHLNQLMAKHMSEGWSASNYATALSLSTGHLSRLCRNATGLGATAYIEHGIMGEACRLLAFTQLPISQIGYRLGYDDPSYFSKRFRAARHQAPSDYRTQFVNKG